MTTPFSFTVRNNGPSIATLVVVDFFGIDGLNFTDINTGKGTYSQDKWRIGVMVAGEEVTFSGSAEIIEEDVEEITFITEVSSDVHSLGIDNDRQEFTIKAGEEDPLEKTGYVLIGNRDVSREGDDYTASDAPMGLNAYVLYIGNEVFIYHDYRNHTVLAPCSEKFPDVHQTMPNSTYFDGIWDEDDQCWYLFGLKHDDARFVKSKVVFENGVFESIEDITVNNSSGHEFNPTEFEGRMLSSPDAEKVIVFARTMSQDSTSYPYKLLVVSFKNYEVKNIAEYQNFSNVDFIWSTYQNDNPCYPNWAFYVLSPESGVYSNNIRLWTVTSLYDHLIEVDDLNGYSMVGKFSERADGKYSDLVRFTYGNSCGVQGMYEFDSTEGHQVDISEANHYYFSWQNPHSGIHYSDEGVLGFSQYGEIVDLHTLDNGDIITEEIVKGLYNGGTQHPVSSFSLEYPFRWNLGVA